MKKFYIFLSQVALVSGVFAQAPKSMPAGALFGSAVKTERSNVLFDNDTKTGSLTKPKSKTVSARGANLSSFVRIGSTYYDLQSNYSTAHRVVMHKDQAISAAWTTSNSSAQGFPGRGTGYNFRTTAGLWSPSDSNRVENVRTGWPCIGVLSNGNVFTIGHDATNGGFYMTVSNSASSRPSVTTSILQDAPYKPIWARAASNGDTIHLICSYTDSAAPGEKRAPTRKGIFAPMVYSRSLDGGKNWDIKHIMLPDYDSTLTDNGGADQYNIDVRGNNVAIVNSDLFEGTIVWKSADFGTTWKRFDAMKFKYAPYKSKTLMIDTPFTADGTCDVLIDHNGKVHAFWGLSRVLDDDTTDTQFSFYPGYQGLMYWNEDMVDGGKLVASGSAFDLTGDGINTLRPATTAALSSGALPSGMNTVARLGNTAALRSPNAGIDANGNIFCVFSLPIEDDISDLDANYRDLGIVYSKDGGTTWGTPQNITQSIGMEDDYGSVARDVNDFVHVVWQQDDIPGTNLQNNSNVANHEVVLNRIMYQAIPVKDIFDETIGLANVDQPNTGEVMIVNQNYPNPFENTTNVMVWLTRPGDVKIEVRNMMGALVKTQTFKDLFKGNHELTINGADLTSGVYTYTLIAGGNSVSKTMMVK
jgi:hypothetical protein